MRWIIGDIHGMRRPLQTLLDAVRQRDTEAMFYFAGDYVNRGPESRGVVDILLSLPPGTARFCRGNHDDIFDLIINGKSFAAGNNPVPVFAWFMAHGLDRTLLSYDIDEQLIEYCQQRPTPQRLEDLIAPVPLSHRTFFRHLPLVIEERDFFIIHAKWSTEESDVHPDLHTPITQHPKMKHRVLWERFSDEEIVRRKHWQRRGFFGHTPVLNYIAMEESVPIVQNKCVLIDTGVALSTNGRLTAFCVETDEFVQTDHFGELVPSSSGRG